MISPRSWAATSHVQMRRLCRSEFLHDIGLEEVFIVLIMWSICMNWWLWFLALKETFAMVNINTILRAGSSKYGYLNLHGVLSCFPSTSLNSTSQFSLVHDLSRYESSKHDLPVTCRLQRLLSSYIIDNIPLRFLRSHLRPEFITLSQYGEPEPQLYALCSIFGTERIRIITTCYYSTGFEWNAT